MGEFRPLATAGSADCARQINAYSLCDEMSHSNNRPEVDEVLRKIGRNVLNFQRMEAMLKFLISRLDLQGTANELKANHEKAVDIVSRQTMGNLVKGFLSTVYAEKTADEESEKDIQEAQFSFSFRIEADPQHILERKNSLEHLVKERNILIHQLLINFDQTSPKSCREMSELLDAQAERLRPEYEWLRSIIRTFREGSKAALEKLEKEFQSNANVRHH